MFSSTVPDFKVGKIGKAKTQILTLPIFAALQAGTVELDPLLDKLHIQPQPADFVG